MSDKEPQAKEFRELVESMHDLCEIMPQVIFSKYFESNRSLYSLYFEAFNSIKGFCVLLGNGCLIPQACAVLRMAIECTATIRVLEMHKELLYEYIEHQKFRYLIRNEDKKSEIIKNHYKDRFDPQKLSPLNYLEYGWFQSLDEECNIKSLIALSKIQEQNDALVKWKIELNQWTHGILEYINLLSDMNNSLIYAHTLILIATKLLDVLVCEFHKENGFNFKIKGFDYRNKFLDAYFSIK